MNYNKHWQLTAEWLWMLPALRVRVRVRIRDGRIKYAIASADIARNYAELELETQTVTAQVIYRKTSLRNMWHVHFACHTHNRRATKKLTF